MEGGYYTETEVGLDAWCEGGLGQQSNEVEAARRSERVESPGTLCN